MVFFVVRHGENVSERSPTVRVHVYVVRYEKKNVERGDKHHARCRVRLLLDGTCSKHPEWIRWREHITCLACLVSRI